MQHRGDVTGAFYPRAARSIRIDTTKMPSACYSFARPSKLYNISARRIFNVYAPGDENCPRHTCRNTRDLRPLSLRFRRRAAFLGQRVDTLICKRVNRSPGTRRVSCILLIARSPSTVKCTKQPLLNDYINGSPPPPLLREREAERICAY